MESGEVDRPETSVEASGNMGDSNEAADVFQRVASWISARALKPADFLFPSRLHVSAHVSTSQHARIVHRWVASIGLDDAAYGTHTMRRTKAALIYRRTKNLRAVQLLLGHTKLESTVRYLGIEVDDALEMAEQTEV
jgi:integrase